MLLCWTGCAYEYGMLHVKQCLAIKKLDDLSPFPWFVPPEVGVGKNMGMSFYCVRVWSVSFRLIPKSFKLARYFITIAALHTSFAHLDSLNLRLYVQSNIAFIQGARQEPERTSSVPFFMAPRMAALRELA